MLIGSYNHQLDAKNRFRIPSKFKKELGENLVVVKGTNKSLFLMSEDNLQTDVFDKMQNISMFDETAQKSLRILLSSSHELETDNQGRSLLPSNLKEFANITKNIVIIGVGRRVEIWAEEEWNKYNEELNFDEEVKNLSGYGV